MDSFLISMLSTPPLQKHEKIAKVAKNIFYMLQHVGVCAGVIKFWHVMAFNISN